MKKLFEVNGNPDMHLEDKNCDNDDFKLMMIPPHRSQRIPLKLSTDKKLKGIFDLKVDMKFYCWNKVGNFHDDIKNHPPLILSDIITLKFNKQENAYTAKADWMEVERKRRQIMPTTDLYLLSEEDRKELTVSIDKSKISQPVDYNDPYQIKKKSIKKLIKIPVVIHNNGNKTLKYFSMSCSWQDYYHSNNPLLMIPPSICEYNVPTTIEILPHQSYLKELSIVYDPNRLKGNEKLKIGVNINKNFNDNPFDADYDELTKYNLVWSNEIFITNYK